MLWPLCWCLLIAAAVAAAYAASSYAACGVVSMSKGSVDCVKKVQSLLGRYLAAEGGTVSGIFGEKTVRAVKKLQSDKCLDADGQVDEKTWSALETGASSCSITPPAGGDKYDDALARQLFALAAGSYADEAAFQSCATRLGGELLARVSRRCGALGALGAAARKLLSAIGAQSAADAVDPHCVAYVAVHRARKVVSLAFRGTESPLGQLSKEVFDTLTSEPKAFAAGGVVQKYFLDVFLDLWSGADGVEALLKKARSACADCSLLWVTGHSLGGALASLTSAHVASIGMWPGEQMRLITYGMPRVGDHRYAAALDRLVPSSYRVVNGRDIVPHLPTCDEPNNGQLNGLECMRTDGEPYHHGVEVFYPDGMQCNAPYLVCEGAPVNEDRHCSNGQFSGAIARIEPALDDHSTYFGVDTVSGFGKRGCPAPGRRDERVVGTHCADRCDDAHELCAVRAAAGECADNLWMQRNCKKACNMCRPSPAGHSRTAAPTRAADSASPLPTTAASRARSHAQASKDTCVDVHLGCSYWASLGECTTHPEFMTHNCPRACRLCSSPPPTK